MPAIVVVVYSCQKEGMITLMISITYAEGYQDKIARHE